MRSRGGASNGADLEFLERPEWKAVRETYPLRFGAAQAYAPTFMYRALESGQQTLVSTGSVVPGPQKCSEGAAGVRGEERD